MSYADDILAVNDLPSETVEVPEWNGMRVVVRGLDGEQASKYQGEVVQWDEKGKPLPPDMTNFMPKLLVKALYAEDGTRIFRDDQVGALAKKSGAVLTRLGKIAMRLSGMDDESADKTLKN